jgi:hypothetical protein
MAGLAPDTSMRKREGENNKDDDNDLHPLVRWLDQFVFLGPPMIRRSEEETNEESHESERRLK